MDLDESTTRCAQCGRELMLGDDCLVIEKAVQGPRGLVPLNELEFFCCESCVSLFYRSDDEAVEELKARIP